MSATTKFLSRRVARARQLCGAAALLLPSLFPLACSDTNTSSKDESSDYDDADPKGLDSGDAPPTPDAPVVTPHAETAAVKGFGDAADDPAIWVNPKSPEKSLVFGTDKTVSGGLFVYNLDGSERDFLPLGELNNVDLRSGFELDDRVVTLITATNRTDDSLSILALDEETLEVEEVAAEKFDTVTESYGLCMYKSPEGKFYSFVNGKDGTFLQFELTADEDEVEAKQVRSFCLETQPEGCVVDDEHQRIFVGEEGFGLWVFPAEESADSTGDEKPKCDGAIAGTKIASTLDGVLSRDVEGIALADSGDGEGHLVVSAQGKHEFVVFERNPPYKHELTFAVWGGGDECIDGVEETDGLDVTATPVGKDYPNGLLVVQDGFNGDPLEKQNFKLVDFGQVLDLIEDPKKEFENNLECNIGDYGGKPRFAGLPPGPERTEEFCVAFCGKCNDCYEEGDPEFSEGDCHYKSGKPNFAEEDCLDGCAVGLNPADTRPLQGDWENWECLDLDDAL